MNAKALKEHISPLLRTLRIDALFRYLNREKVLILAYHGITRKRYAIQPWVLIPEKSFEEQMAYISRFYRVVSLAQAAMLWASGERIPKNTAVITFDDGYRNNYTVALPILKHYNVPATVFLTAGYIGSNKLLPMDEAYLIIVTSRNKKPLTICELGLGPLYFDSDDALTESYKKTVSALKRRPTCVQHQFLRILREATGAEYNHGDIIEDFRMLTWEEVKELLGSDLITIGAHTVSHEILTNVQFKDACREIDNSRLMLQAKTGTDVNLFAYPNGKPQDFADNHVRYLKDSGFNCSVTTVSRLNANPDDPYRLGRICVGPELAGDLNHFALKVSGAILAIRGRMCSRNLREMSGVG